MAIRDRFAKEAARAQHLSKRVFGPVLRPIQGLGWVALGLAVGCFLIGRMLGWIEFAVPAAVLIAALVIAALLTIGRSTYQISLHLADRRVTMGDRAMGSIIVRNASRRRLLPARIELPVGTNSATFALPSLPAEGCHEELFAIPTDRRAVITVGPVRSVRGDALGLIARRVEWTEPVELYVHPQIVTLSEASAGVLRDLEGHATHLISDNDMSFHALREYVLGDDRRNIHWKSTARLGTLMVRQFEDTRRTHTALGLATNLREYRSTIDAELAISVFASLGAQTLFDERELTAFAGEQSLLAATPPRFLDHCSGIALGNTDPTSVNVARKIAREVPDASVVFLLTGDVLSPLEVRQTTVHFPAGLRIVAFSCHSGTSLEIRNHDAFSQIQLGRLKDLSRALRSVIPE